MADEVRLGEIVKELAMIRKLVMAAMLKSGISQGAIGEALGMDQSSISRMLGGVKKPGAKLPRGKKTKAR